MLTESRKRQHSGGDEESGHLVPQAKRQSRAHPLSPEPGRDAWDSELSNSESSSSISSPEHAAGHCSSQCVVGPCSPLSSGDSLELTGPTNMVSYLQINRILKEAHFQSLQNRDKLFCLCTIIRLLLYQCPRALNIQVQALTVRL